MTEVRSFPNGWQSMALVCRKCTKKLGGGFGRKGRHDLADIVQQRLKETGRRRAVRFHDVGCLDLCPKRAVTVALPGRLLSIPEGTDAEAIIAAMGLPAPAAPDPAGH